MLRSFVTNSSMTKKIVFARTPQADEAITTIPLNYPAPYIIYRCYGSTGFLREPQDRLHERLLQYPCILSLTKDTNG
jgi:hypothetical protein